MIGRDQAKINTLILPLKSKPGGCAVQMAIVALLHAVLLQQFYDRGAGIPGGHRRIMKKTIFSLSPAASNDIRIRPTSLASTFSSWASGVSSKNQPRLPHKATSP